MNWTQYDEVNHIIERLLNGETWLSYIASQDGYPLPADPGYDEHIAAINAAFDRDSVDGLLHIHRITRIYAERIKDLN
jgi:hypothetical protein